MNRKTRRAQIGAQRNNTKRLGALGPTTAAALLAAASAVPVSIFFGTPTASADGYCDGLTIGIGGLGESQSPPEATTIIENLLADQAAQGANTEKLSYSSSMWPIAGNYTLDESVRNGEDALAARVGQYRGECPGAPVTVIGHSEGALVAGNRQDLADKTVLYSDPRRNGGVLDAFSGIVPGVSSDGPRELGPNTVSICNQHDFICDSEVVTPAGKFVDPVHLIQGLVGYAFQGRHGYLTQDLPAGDHLNPTPPPVTELPSAIGLDIVDPPTAPLPKWEPGPLPAVFEVPAAWTPQPEYVSTPVVDYLPPVVRDALPAEVQEFLDVPLPALPVITLPALPDLGIRLP